MPPIDRDAARDASATPPALAAWIAPCRERGVVAFDVETDAADEMRAEPVGIGPGDRRRARPAYLPVGHVTGSGGLFDEPADRPDPARRGDGAR